MLRPAFAALSAVSPSLAAPVAERLFLTAPRYEAPAREREALASAQRTILRAGDTPITTWTWGRGPVVLLVHGWGGRGGQLARFAAPLVAAGYSVVTFDAPGHGAAPDRRSSLVAFVEAIHAVNEALGPVRGVIGHSMGAAAAAIALRDGLPAAAAVFVAPPMDLTLRANITLDTLGFGRRARELTQARIEQRFGVPWSAFDVRAFAPAMRTPLRVIHDRDDVEIPWQDGATIAQAWPGATLTSTSDLGHRRILADAGVVREAVEFLLAELHWSVPAAADATDRAMASSAA